MADQPADQAAQQADQQAANTAISDADKAFNAASKALAAADEARQAARQIKTPLSSTVAEAFKKIFSGRNNGQQPPHQPPISSQGKSNIDIQKEIMEVADTILHLAEQQPTTYCILYLNLLNIRSLAEMPMQDNVRLIPLPSSDTAIEQNNAMIARSGEINVLLKRLQDLVDSLN